MSLGLAALRAVHFWAVAVCLGGGGLLALLRPPRPASGLVALRVAAAVAGATGLAWFASTFVGVTGAPASLLSGGDWTAFLAAPFGPGWAVLLGLSVAAVGLAAFVRPLPALSLGAAFAIDQAWLGHAAAGTGAFGIAMLASDAAHVLAAFAWLGALTILCLSLRRPETLTRGLAIVSGGGLLVVAIIIASGCFNGFAQIEDLSELATTAYGRILVAKVALVALMLAFAAFNRAEAAYGVTRGLAVSIGIETGIGLVVLALAALLGITDPPGR